MDGEAPSTNKTATRWPGGLLSHTCQEIHPQSPNTETETRTTTKGVCAFLKSGQAPGHLFLIYLSNNNFHSDHSSPTSRWRLVGSDWTRRFQSSPCPHHVLTMSYSISQDIVKQHGGSWLVSSVHWLQDHLSEESLRGSDASEDNRSPRQRQWRQSRGSVAPLQSRLSVRACVRLRAYFCICTAVIKRTSRINI